MIRRPPRSTLFPYNDALPISLARGSNHQRVNRLLRHRVGFLHCSRGPTPARSRCGARRLALLRSEEHTSELQSQSNLVCRLLLEKKKKKKYALYTAKKNKSTY